MAPIFGSRNEKPPPLSGPVPLNWVRNKNGNFFKFATFNVKRAGLAGGGVFVIWHSGTKPDWVMVGASTDLAESIGALLDDAEVLEYDARGGLFVTWTLIRSEYHAGVLKFLRESMNPLIDRDPPSSDKIEAIPVIPPGAKGETPV